MDKRQISYQSVQELVETAENDGVTIGQVVLADQAAQLEQSPDALFTRMAERLQVMRQAAEDGLRATERSPSGLSGGAAARLQAALDENRTIAGPLLARMLARALAVSEVNARMGRIVAAPTAGSCGILPAVILTFAEEKALDERTAVLGLWTASGIGMVIANQASLSGAEGGCQAECGSAAAMAAAAAVEMLGGSPRQAAEACAIALKSVLGLVCDPVAGLVEVPCIKRNASGAANALVAAELALAGIASAIPADEVIAAMRSVGDQLPASLRETAAGGLAATPTGREIARRLADAVRVTE
ncbi:MAG: L-serine ammonia-lyase, iron-sulfur-dependent, subunit alpha [Clostridiaceae bacterium]|nr:L-serine ammonia-lyase, iron-sulfur-dependent, subunit alpha [Eubacteriales bacterium]MDD4743768.1 L-serine ammonia-lyase, iron-sulfur-dependent, subunit alpha [Eubacteriales bacterium]NLB45206.1 L-serine ammonia-lyase, iron-sulfur-dependent, subunit alpha [Clostridiaceae bacterium]